MEFVLLPLSLIIFLIAIGVYVNRRRARHETYDSLTLQNNCLLTRWPLVFVTGPRSFFYFDSYWNAYTSYLAEHGYEVFKLHLPWRNTELRQKQFERFLRNQEKAGGRFHVFMDSSTLGELETLLRHQNPNTPTLQSVTEIMDSDLKPLDHRGLPVPFMPVQCLPSQKSSAIDRWTFRLHRVLTAKPNLPTLSTLGACEDTALLNARLLLERAQSLAETDLCHE